MKYLLNLIISRDILFKAYFSSPSEPAASLRGVPWSERQVGVSVEGKFDYYHYTSSLFNYYQFS